MANELRINLGFTLQVPPAAEADPFVLADWLADVKAAVGNMRHALPESFGAVVTESRKLVTPRKRGDAGDEPAGDGGGDAGEQGAGA